MTSRKSYLALGLVLACALAAQMTLAQQEPTPAELKKDIEALKETLKAIQGDLQEIKTLLQGRAPREPQPPASVELDLGNHPFRGAPDARLTLVEFTDYQCPFCARHVRDTYPQIEKEYIETGKLKYVLLDFPLESIHKQAFQAAQASRCAGEQGKAWEMRKQLFANQRALTDLAKHAEAVGLNVAEFDACLKSGKYAEAVRKDLAQGQSAGVSGTPAFFLAFNEPGSSKVKTVRAIRGARPFAAFKAQIDALLAEQQAAKTEEP
jgi:protein-disulfide isomerase